MKFYDTNALLELQGSAFDEPFAVSQQTLIEIEHIKTSRNKDDAVKYQARAVARLISQNAKLVNVVFTDSAVYDIVKSFSLSLEEPDNIICGAAYYYNQLHPVQFVTNDINCYNMACSVFQLDVAFVNDDKEIYKGYIEIFPTDDELASLYEHMNDNTYGLNINEYLVINDKDGKCIDIEKWNGERYEQVKPRSFKSFHLGNVKPLDPIQRCAMDSIAENDITAMFGNAGSGKSLLALSYFMQQHDKGKMKRCYFIYSYEPLRGARELGYEKGDHITKLLYSASIGNILSSKFGDMTEVERLIEDGVIEIIPTANIRGMEIPSDCMVIVTEAQNIDVYTLKTIIQRCKEGCRIVIEGDMLSQTDKNMPVIGMDRMIDVFKNHNCFGCVKLKNNYRSKLSGLADLM